MARGGVVTARVGAAAAGIEVLAGRSVAELLGEEYARRRDAELSADGERVAVWARPANLSRLQLLLEHVASGAPLTDPTMRAYARDIAGDAERLRLRWEAQAAKETRQSWERETLNPGVPLLPRFGRETMVAASLWASYLVGMLLVAIVVATLIARAVWLATPP